MSRDIDPRPHEPERPDPSRGSRAGTDSDDRGRTGPRDVFADRLDLPRGAERERVHVRTRTYELRGSEVRTLATVGAFRVVPASDLRDHNGHAADPRKGDLSHLRDLGLVRTMPYVVEKTRTTLVTLTEQGRNVLEDARRDHDRERQTYYAGIAKPRELSHDAQLYRAYLRTAERLEARDARIRRIVLDYELKREYQRFLQASNRGRRDSDGRPDREEEEIERWAHEHHLPIVDDHVQFPDVRIEYDERDGRREVEDVEVTTEHYRGAMAGAKARAGFTSYRAAGTRLGGSRKTGRGGRGVDPRVAEEVLG
jgi:hypothetical protein